MPKKLGYIRGVVILIVAILLLLFVAGPVQRALGLWGVFITELLLLALALVSAKLFGLSFKETFPIKKLRVREIGGMALMYAPTLLIGVVLTFVTGYFFPHSYSSVVGIQNITTSMPLLVSWLIIAVMPAICEEALFRGTILRTFSGVKNKWAVVIAMSVMFGVFHLDPIRFGATGLLGGVMTYIALETGNTLMPVLYHLFNNTVSVITNHLSASDVTSPAVTDFISGPMMLVTIGACLVLCVPAIPIMRGGAALVKPRTDTYSETEDERKTRLGRRSISRRITVVALIVILAAGVTLITMNAGNVAQ